MYVFCNPLLRMSLATLVLTQLSFTLKVEKKSRKLKRFHIIVDVERSCSFLSNGKRHNDHEKSRETKTSLQQCQELPNAYWNQVDFITDGDVV